eukprot:TRINITY_DN13231_c0_g1_i5.p1 TRINITY_DN13231_c0_g1~~TRINITY_DN13231_c0_g1_i5.p1  ORF type:complete len:198 (+),score=33.76 TRINITY_DN13231_c0_g1_i5:86-679(+)
MGCAKSTNKPVAIPGSTPNCRQDGEFDNEFKVIITGDAGVGKTSLLLRLCKQSFTEGPAINAAGVDFDNHDVQVGGLKIRLQIWDTAGQERFRTITSSFYRGSHGIIFAFDINNFESYQNCSKWVKEAERYGDNVAGRIVVATKCDNGGKRAVTQNDIMNLTDNFDLKFLETSAKDNINVQETFRQLTEMILEELQK